MQSIILLISRTVNGGKAKFFEEVLGLTAENSKELPNQLVFDGNKAVQAGVTALGIKFTQIIPITGANGRVVNVLSVWIKNNDNVVRLVTAFPAM